MDGSRGPGFDSRSSHLFFSSPLICLIVYIYLSTFSYTTDGAERPGLCLHSEDLLRRDLFDLYIFISLFDYTT
jgi:hypothetical protein